MPKWLRNDPYLSALLFRVRVAVWVSLVGSGLTVVAAVLLGLVASLESPTLFGTFVVPVVGGWLILMVALLAIATVLVSWACLFSEHIAAWVWDRTGLS